MSVILDASKKKKKEDAAKEKKVDAEKFQMEVARRKAERLLNANSRVFRSDSESSVVSIDGNPTHKGKLGDSEDEQFNKGAGPSHQFFP